MRCGARMRKIGVALLLREYIAVQPVEQLLPVGSDDAGLWKMQMRVDKAGRDEMRAMIGNGECGALMRQQRRGIADRLDKAVGLMIRPSLQ